jgi:hypothetical protein
MSNRYKGAVISATPPTTTGGEEGTASGAWTLEQQMQLQAAGLWPAQPTGPYIEQVFSTYLYTGTDANQTITNGIDLSTKGGLVWTKMRSVGVSHALFDTVRGGQYRLTSNDSAAQADQGASVITFNTNGYTWTALNNAWNNTTYGTNTYVGWTFREQPKFFDIVTATVGASNILTFSHALGSTPGFIVVKSLNNAGGWLCYHRSLGTGAFLQLQSTSASVSAPNIWAVSSTSVTLDGGFATGTDVVAYLFAHDAGGFGLTGTDNVISCGSFTTDGSSNATISLGYEPQWVMVKKTSGADSWYIVDNMRGFFATPATTSKYLQANASEPEYNFGAVFGPNATGFNFTLEPTSTYIYIAIRRGPMAVPTLGTSVFSPVTRTGTSTAVSVTGVGFPPDMMWSQYRNSAGNDNPLYDKLRGPSRTLFKNLTDAEQTPASYGINSFDQDGVSLASNQSYTNNSGSTYIYDFFRRAPSFFDEVCYTGTGSATTQTHNLGVVPELMIVKTRSDVGTWSVVVTISGFTGLTNGTAQLQVADEFTVGFMPTYYNSLSPTASVINLGTSTATNGSGRTYVAYLFATCAGVSKVGSYTGTGAAQTINCGFTAGSRFVLIKRTDSTGDWYMWDSARGIIPSNDPYLLINSTAAEVTGTDYVDTTNVGFDITSTAPAAINANGGTFIFLAIA